MINQVKTVGCSVDGWTAQCDVFTESSDECSLNEVASVLTCRAVLQSRHTHCVIPRMVLLLRKGPVWMSACTIINFTWLAKSTAITEGSSVHSERHLIGAAACDARQKKKILGRGEHLLKVQSNVHKRDQTVPFILLQIAVGGRLKTWTS